jgi:hypothetical protein
METRMRSTAFLQTVCAGTSQFDGVGFRHVPDDQVDRRMMVDWLAHRSDGLDEKSKDYANAVGTATYGQRVFRSDKEFMGLAPQSELGGIGPRFCPVARCLSLCGR